MVGGRRRQMASELVSTYFLKNFTNFVGNIQIFTLAHPAFLFYAILQTSDIIV